MLCEVKLTSWHLHGWVCFHWEDREETAELLMFLEQHWPSETRTGTCFPDNTQKSQKLILHSHMICICYLLYICLWLCYIVQLVLQWFLLHVAVDETQWFWSLAEPQKVYDVWMPEPKEDISIICPTLGKFDYSNSTEDRACQEHLNLGLISRQRLSYNNISKRSAFEFSINTGI